MNVNSVNNQNLIDVQSASKVAQDLFSTLSQKSVDYSKIDLSKFNRQSLGVDFYNRKTDINFERQIAIANSGAFDNKMNLNAVQALNAFAASNLYADNVQKSVGGKMTIDAAQGDIELISKNENYENTQINVFESEKDKKDSNPFYYGENSSQTQEEA